MRNMGKRSHLQLFRPGQNDRNLKNTLKKERRGLICNEFTGRRRRKGAKSNK